MKRIYLTVLHKELTQEAQDRLDEFEDLNEYPTDDEGRDREYYDNMAIAIPKEILDKENLLSKGLKFEEKDYEYTESMCVLRLKNYSAHFGTTNGGSKVFLIDGTFINVVDDAGDIDDYIDYLKRGKWTRLKEIVWDLWMNNPISRYRRRRKFKNQQIINN